MKVFARPRLAANTVIEYNNQAIRQIIDCIKVISQDEITIIFKGGFERTAPLR